MAYLLTAFSYYIFRLKGATAQVTQKKHVGRRNVTKNDRFHYGRVLSQFLQAFSQAQSSSSSVHLFNKIYGNIPSLSKVKAKKFKKFKKFKKAKKIRRKPRLVRYSTNFIRRISRQRALKQLPLVSRFANYKSISKTAMRYSSGLSGRTPHSNLIFSGTLCLPYFYRKVNFSFSPSKAKFKGKAKNNRAGQRKRKRKRHLFTSPIKTRAKYVKPEAVYFKLYPTAFQESALNIKGVSQLKSLLSVVTNSRFSFYQLNAVSLARFAFDQERRQSKNMLVKATNTPNQKKSLRVKFSQRFLYSLERERNSRFRYVAIFIKDLIRVCFFGRYLKKAAFVASFFAFARSKLPRNRKETKFVRFLRKLVKIFASQRKERLGLRIRFQGRVNR